LRTTVQLGAQTLGTQTFADLASRLTNWGRWGETDELGTLNLLDSGSRRSAVNAVTGGSAFSLALPLDAAGPTSSRRGGPVHLMLATGCDPEGSSSLAGGARFTDDYIVMPLQCSTQWDGLAHIYYGDVIYNGYPATSVSSAGAARNGIEKAAGHIAGRAVLLDFPALIGDDAPRQCVITAADLDAMCARQKVAVQPGDIIVLRTGSMALWKATGSWREFRRDQSGLGLDCLPWFHERDVAAVAADNATVELAGYYSDYFIPLHMVGIRDMGLWLGEYWYLEDLAAACAADGRWDCFLSAQVMPITGAVGSPVSPVALR
jgi:kynurenine formamidase